MVHNKNNIKEIGEQKEKAIKEKAIKNVLATYGNLLYRTAYVFLGNPHDAQDVLQETLVKYMEKAPVFREITALPAKWKSVLLLHYVEGYSIKETAKITGLTENAETTTMEEFNRAVRGITMPEQMTQDLLEGCLSQNRTAVPRFRYPKWIAAALAIILFTAVSITPYAAYNLYQTKNLTVFFDYGITEEQINAIGKELETIPGIYSLHYTSSDKAWAEFRQEFLPEDIAVQFTENPLKNSSNYCVTVKLDADTAAIREQITELDGVRLVNDRNELREAEKMAAISTEQ